MGRPLATIPVFFALLLAGINVQSQDEKDWVDTTQYKYISDGCWCWFQDERAVIDTTNNKLIVGSTNMQSSCDVTIFNIESKKVESSKRFGRLDYSDDHNAPAVMVTADGNYLAVWAHHYDKYNHHYSIYDGSGWSREKTFDWQKIPGGTDYTIAYSNLYYLAKEKRIYNFSRANDRAPNFLYSEDNGQNWKFGGQLTTNSSSSYNKGYYKYWGNGEDRIDMVFTEEHPRDQKTSIYHGYIQDGKTYNTFGDIANEDIYDRGEMPTFDAFTKVFEHGTEIDGVHMGRCWQHDIARYDDGTIVILFKARADDEIDDHRNFYARFDGEEWKYTYIGKAGKHIYGNEHDYVGLGSVNPDDPNRIYICSAYNPGDDDESPARYREIWRGTTLDDGETWDWEPVTKNSTQDNFRPIVPKWTRGKEAVLWFKGDYQTAQKVYASVYGTFYEYAPPPVTAARPTPAVKKTEKTTFSCQTRASGVTMKYHVPYETNVTLEMFSLNGKNTAKVMNATVAEGTHSFTWNTAKVSSGVYLARLRVGAEVRSVMVTLQ